jgi:hypothetical protein
VTRGLGTTLGMVNRAVLAGSEREKKIEKNHKNTILANQAYNLFFLYLNFDFDVPNILLIS